MTDANEIGVQDLNWAIGLNRLSLRLMGVWPDNEDFQTNFLKTVLRIPVMISAMFFFILVPQMYALALIGNNLLFVIDNFMTSWPAFTCCLKLFFLWINKEVLRPVVNSVTEDWLRPKQDWERETMKNDASLAKFLTIGGYVFMTASYAGFIIAPLFGLDIRLVSNVTDYGKHHLLVQSYYPYDYSKSPNFELTHLSQLFAGTCIAMSLAIPDNYFGALVFHLSAQFEILGVRIEHFIREDEQVLTEKKSKDFNRNVGIYVDRHVHLIRMVSAVEKSFALLIMTQLVCMCGMACCLGFRILHMFGSDEKIPIIQVINLGAAFISLLLFTLADCSASETLAFSSTEIFYNIYNSKWYMVPKQDTRDLVIMMTMAKNPQALSAGKIMYLSMSTYCYILKTIAGYLSVLIAASN